MLPLGGGGRAYICNVIFAAQFTDYIKVFVCFVCVLICLLMCLFVCSFVCLFVCLLACAPVCSLISFKRRCITLSFHRKDKVSSEHLVSFKELLSTHWFKHKNQEIKCCETEIVDKLCCISYSSWHFDIFNLISI